MYKAYCEKPWKGAHSINCKADAYDSYTLKSGATAGQAVHRCLRCGVLVRRNKLPESVCELDAKRGPSLALPRERLAGKPLGNTQTRRLEVDGKQR